jgi:hypothetical protein
MIALFCGVVLLLCLVAALVPVLVWLGVWRHE